MKPEIYASTITSGSDVSSRPRIDCRASGRLLAILLAVFIAVLLAPFETASAQTFEDFDVTTVIKDVKKRFNLSSRDIKSIRPLLNRENNSVLAIYARFSGGEPEYSNRVWRDIAASHCEFRTRIQNDLTRRQSAAVRAARSGMEARVVDYLLEDYVDFLGHVLELDRWEHSDVQKLFESDKAKKLRLFSTGLPVEFGVIQKDVEKISEETERQLQRLLTEEQWRNYRSLTESPIPTA